jgi:hypothetical protein
MILIFCILSNRRCPYSIYEKNRDHRMFNTIKMACAKASDDTNVTVTSIRSHPLYLPSTMWLELGLE